MEKKFLSYRNPTEISKRGKSDKRVPIIVGSVVLGVMAVEGVFSPTKIVQTPLKIEMHYAPAENLELLDVNSINQAGKTIDIAAYVLTDIPIITALSEAGARGVKVRIYRDATQRGKSAKLISALEGLEKTTNIEQRFKRSSVYMHLKSYCIDGELLREGAANFSASGEIKQDNDLAFIMGTGACETFEHNFGKIWEQAK